MSHTTVEARMTVPFEGKVESGPNFPNSVITGAANALIYFGKAVAVEDPTDLTLADQKVEHCASAADVGALLGVAIADTSKEALSTSYGGYVATEDVPILRKGRIWVVVETAITSLLNGVYVRFQNAGGSPPAASLGSFTSATGADFTQVTAGAKWIAAATVGSVNYGLLELDL